MPKSLQVELLSDSLERSDSKDLKNAIEVSFLASFRLMMMISAGLVLIGTFVAWVSIERLKPH